MEVVDLSTPRSPNKDDLEDALGKALRIYRNCMRPFIMRHLRKVPGEKPEDLIVRTLSDQQADQFWTTLDKGSDIESAIDFSYFPAIIQKNWLIERNRQNYGFNQQFDADMTFQSRLWLIREGRNIGEHEDTKVDSEFVRIHLFLIGEVLNKINEPDRQSEVEKIRTDLFSDDTAERLAETEERLKDVEKENAKYKKSFSETKKRLADAESKNSEYEEDTVELSRQVDQKENRINKLLKQQKEAKAQNEKSKKDLARTKRDLEKSKAARTDYKRRFATQSRELKDTKKELASVLVEKNDYEKCLTGTQNLLTTVAIGEQTIFPPLGTNAPVRILDRRNTEKKSYLLNLLEQKQPTIVYVQNEEKIDELLNSVVPEKTDVIKRHNRQTSEAEETEILGKLENGELIATVSTTTFSTLTLSHPVEHFIFCHLVPGLDEFFKRCEPAFTSAKNAYLHLIYNNEKDIEGLERCLTQQYPDKEALRGTYRELKSLAKANGGFVKLEKFYKDLDMVELGIETGLAIFEELGFLERDGEGNITPALSPMPRELDESEIYRRGENLKEKTADFRTFQLEHSIEQIWEKMLEALNVDTKQILRDSSIHKMPLRVSETEGDYLKDTQTQPEQSTEVVEKDSAASDKKGLTKPQKGRTREKKPNIAERYTSETTEADRDELAVKIAKIRINATGSKPIAWRKIREKFGLKNDQFHKVIRHSKGYRKAVINRIKQLKSRPEGWEYSGKLEVLTGIELSESELL